jgi:hypothetical protein
MTDPADRKATARDALDAECAREQRSLTASTTVG